MSYLILSSRKTSILVILEVAAIVLLTITALHPLMRGQLPLTADGELHLYRLISLDHAVSGNTLADGSLWPRYVAGMVYGYGAPMFNYYSPLSLYPLEAFHLLGASFSNAWLLGMALYMLIAALGAYLLGRAWGGRICGLVSAVAYTYAPYMLYDLVARGTVAELAALSLLPWVLWALWRLALNGKRLDFAMTAVFFALFIPMHNVVTLHAAALIGIFALLFALQSSQKWRTLVRLVTALGIGVALVAFFWLPAITETRYIKLDAITANLPFIDVIANLTPLSAVLGWPITADPTQMQPPTPIALGWPQILLTALGFVMVMTGASKRSLRLVAMGTVGLIALLVFMNTPPSAFLWRTIPLIRYSQYPWRLLGPASLLLALMAGLGLTLFLEHIRVSTWIQRGILAVTLAAMMVYGLPWLYPIYMDNTHPESIIDAQNFERESGLIGTSSFGEYLPIWNYEIPAPDSLIERYTSSPDGIIPRLQPPAGITLNTAAWNNTTADLRVTADDEKDLIFDWFYFPGWWARLDDEPIEIRPSEQLGLIEVTIPAGAHRLEIGLGMTDRQSQAALLSLVGVVMLFGMIAWPKNLLFQSFSTPAETMPPDLENADVARLFSMVMLLGIVVFCGKALLIDRIDSPVRRERFVNGDVTGIQASTHINFNREIELIGFDLAESNAVASGEAFSLNLYWRLIGESVNQDYSTVISLRDAQNNLITQQVAWQPGGLSTSHWLPGYYLQERVLFDIPPATPPGEYTLDVSIYEPESQRSLDVINPDDNPVDVKASIGSLTITRPNTVANSDEITTEIHVEKDFDGLRLLGLNALPEAAMVGEELNLQWAWEMTGQTDTNTRAALVWLRDGEVSGSTPELPLVNNFSLENWQTSDIWRGIHRVYVPGSLNSGDYDIAVTIGEAQTIISSMTVSAPERSYDPPSPDFTSQETWDNGIILLGYDLDISSDTQLTLYWNTDAPIQQNLRVFVHVIDAEGRIIAQSDRIPADWTRPTTGWAVGEFITDVHTLTSTEGDQLRLGWYDPITNQRVLLTSDAEAHDALTLTLKR